MGDVYVPVTVWGYVPAGVPGFSGPLPVPPRTCALFSLRLIDFAPLRETLLLLQRLFHSFLRRELRPSARDAGFGDAPLLLR